MGRKMKKARVVEDEDRISKLPDDLIHHIMFFMDTRFAVQTSILSKRWRRVWKTLPFLNFDANEQHYKDISRFLDYFFYRRNRKSPVMKLQLCPGDGLNVCLMKKYVKYAILRNLERLHLKVDRCCSLSTFSSNSLKELNLMTKFESYKLMKSHCWTLPNLTTLILKHCNRKKTPKFPESFVICLPALTTLELSNFQLPKNFSLPALTTLRLESCTLPEKVWNFPALLTLELSNVVFTVNMTDYFLALTSLQNLAIDFGLRNIGCCVIASPLLLNLKIRVSPCISDLTKGKVVVLAPKLHNFNAIGFFLTRFESSELENVTIKFWDREYNTPWQMLEEYEDLVKVMFSQLGSAKILNLDLVTLQALSRIPHVLVHVHSPFLNLKYLKLPHGYEESRICRRVRQYLLGGSPSATIVKPLSLNCVLEEPLATRSHGSKKMVQNFVVDAAKDRQIKPPIAVASNDRANGCKKNNIFLWQGHEVNPEFVGVLDLIMKKYPQTFDKLPEKNEVLLTVKLNTLCSLLNAFTKTPMTEVDTDVFNEFRALFTDLKRWGFNLDWLLRHLNYIEKLHQLHAIDSRIDDAKNKVQDMLTLCAEKMTDLKSFWTMGTDSKAKLHAATASYIGDGLL